MHKISVIIPVYNAEKFLDRCLSSVLGQTYENIEVITVNDGSKDNSLALLRSYAEQDNRIRVIDQENGGVATARNVGLANATGEYILFVDADDWIDPDSVERLLNKMQADIDIVSCSFDHAETPQRSQCEPRVACEIWDHDRQILEFIKHKRMAGMLWNKLIRRSLTNGVSFNEKTGYGEDAEFLWQVLKKSRKMLVTNEVLYHHVLEDTSISHLTYSEKKYSAIPMWERINAEVAMAYPQWIVLAKNSLTCAAVYGMFEARQSGYQNQKHLRYMRTIARKNIFNFLRANDISLKYKLFALAVCVGF